MLPGKEKRTNWKKQKRKARHPAFCFFIPQTAEQALSWTQPAVAGDTEISARLT